MFSRRDEGRIVKTVRRVEAMPDVVSTHRAMGNAVVPEVRVVRITSTTLSAGRYPAELQYRNPSTGVWGSFSPAVVVHVEPLAGETLTTGLIQAQRSGATAAGIAVFTPVEGSGSIDATKRYCRVATTANITLSSDLENGDTLNGVTLATGDRVLVKDQSTASQNGIYVVAASGTASRATDADSWDELVGALVVVSEGTAKADTLWLCTSNAGGTLGSTSVTWAEIGGISATTYASRTVTGIVDHGENTGVTNGVQEFKGVKSFISGIVIGPEVPISGEGSGGGSISFLSSTYAADATIGIQGTISLPECELALFANNVDEGYSAGYTILSGLSPATRPTHDWTTDDGTNQSEMILNPIYWALEVQQTSGTDVRFIYLQTDLKICADSIIICNASGSTLGTGVDGTLNGVTYLRGLRTGGTLTVSGSDISGGTIDGGTW